MEATLRRVIAEAAKAVPGITVEVKRMLLARALTPLPGNAPLVEALSSTARRYSARRSRPRARRSIPTCACTERGIPAVIYGAGPRTVLESNAKRADEHIVLEDLRRATKVVARSLFDLLG